MDSINQLAKTINKIKGTADYAANKRYRPKRVERATDTFDLKVPFTMDFLAKPEDNTTLSLYFKTPAPSLCCGTCYCSVCENFSNNLTITLTYGYISGTLNVFVDNLKVTDFEEIDPDAGTLRLNTTGDNIRICYIYYSGGCSPLGEGGGGGGNCSPTLIDDFNRNVSDSWSNNWSGVGDGYFTIHSVNGAYGVIAFNRIGFSSENSYKTLDTTITGDFDVTWLVLWDSIELTDGTMKLVFSADGNAYGALFVNGDGTSTTIKIVNSSITPLASTDLGSNLSSGIWYKFRLFAEGINDIGMVKAKVWEASGSEPVDWDVEYASNFNESEWFSVGMEIYHTGAGTMVDDYQYVRYDDIIINC